ncbi:MAG: sulfite exporter TauE/SafE family protein [Thomasclavelia sp.]|nr:sulfite exporter TauE/SafE family protein [Thomasclavelia sp.]
MEIYIIIAFLAILGGLIQGVSGFGAGIVVMSVLPYFLSVTSSAAVSSFMSVFLTAMMAYRYRKYINKNDLLLPALFFVVGGTIAIFFSTSIDTGFMKMILGLFLLVLAVYFYFFSSKIKLKADIKTMFICGFISGVCDGLFGVGGPLMVLFFLSLTSSKEEYLGTIQAFFFIVCAYNFIFRVYRGIFTIDLLGFGIISVIAVFVGLQIGNKIVDKIDIEMTKKITYILIGVSGLITFITSL